VTIPLPVNPSCQNGFRFSPPTRLATRRSGWTPTTNVTVGDIVHVTWIGAANLDPYVEISVMAFIGRRQDVRASRRAG